MMFPCEMTEPRLTAEQRRVLAMLAASGSIAPHGAGSWRGWMTYNIAVRHSNWRCSEPSECSKRISIRQGGTQDDLARIFAILVWQPSSDVRNGSSRDSPTAYARTTQRPAVAIWLQLKSAKSRRVRRRGSLRGHPSLCVGSIEPAVAILKPAVLRPAWRRQVDEAARSAHHGCRSPFCQVWWSITCPCPQTRAFF
jgi:hypothetical protein